MYKYEGAKMIIYKNITDWYGLPKCKSCNGGLTKDIVMHSNGICPKCGFDSKSTICDYYYVIARKHTVIQVNRYFPFIHKYTNIETKEPK